jgi:hypothetical protein
MKIHVGFELTVSKYNTIEETYCKVFILSWEADTKGLGSIICTDSIKAKHPYKTLWKVDIIHAASVTF